MIEIESYSGVMAIMTIPKKLAASDDLILIPKKEFHEFMARVGEKLREDDVLRWSRVVKKLRRAGTLSKLV